MANHVGNPALRGAKDRGDRRRLKVTSKHEAAIHRLKAEGQGVTAIARETGLSRPTVYSVLGTAPAGEGSPAPSKAETTENASIRPVAPSAPMTDGSDVGDAERATGATPGGTSTSALERVITGGQTGAEQGAWRAADVFGIPTGGWMPAGFATETPGGTNWEPRPDLARRHGARALPSRDFAGRLAANARDSDGSLWIGKPDALDAGMLHAACARFRRPCASAHIDEGPVSPSHVVAWIRGNQIRTLSVAGSPESESPGIGVKAEQFLADVFTELGLAPRD
jgi:hypothetical protein